jgi:arginyl-tRNA synthetase
MNLFAHFGDVVQAALDKLAASGDLSLGMDLSRAVVEAPRDPSHGDLTTNAALVLAKQAKTNPRELAGKLAAVLKSDPDIAEMSVAGPGFVNITLSEAFWPKVVKAALAEGESYGQSVIGNGEKVNVEYVSANPTGPLHVGHCRGAVFGDALANLLRVAGYDVTTEYYINDAGAQIDVLGRSAFLRYREALGQDIGEIPPGLYPGEYLIPVGKALASKYGRALLECTEEDWLPLVREFASAMMMDLIREDLAALNIRQDVFASEKALHGKGGGKVAKALITLRERGLVYEGRLEPPKGLSESERADWEDREQTLFRSSEHGDDTDRPLVKSDGSYTYFASDVAYALDKYERGFSKMVYVLGADHSGYVKRLEAVMHAVSGGKAEAIVKLCQLVKLFRGGEPVKMSKRAGTFVTLRDVVDEVGPDVVRFMMLYRKNEAPLDFDFDKVTEQSRDNPVFYVQYAHARICSVFRNAVEELGKEVLSGAVLREADLSLLDDAAEIDVIKRIAAYPKIVESAAQASEPHRIAFYLYELSSDFHALWNKGKESPQLRFILKDHMHLTQARLAFLFVIRYVLRNGLGILGVKPMDEM